MATQDTKAQSEQSTLDRVVALGVLDAATEDGQGTFVDDPSATLGIRWVSLAEARAALA